MSDITLHFEGPLTLCEGNRSVFRSPLAALAGVYLWTFRQDADGTHLIHYVGETVSLAKRHREHLIHVLSMNYGIFEPVDAKKGESTMLWPGLWRDRSVDGPSKLLTRYPELVNATVRYIEAITIFFAPIAVDTQLRRHIEGSIGWNLRTKHPHLRSLYPDDNRIGISRKKLNARLMISSAESIHGLDSEISI